MSSSSSCLRARSLSGLSSTVIRWGLSMSQLWISPSKYLSPPAALVLMRRRGSSKQSGARGSPSCSQVLRARSMTASPTGKLPVLFSRRVNSTVLMAASIMLSAMPSLTSPSRVERIRASTLGASSGAIPFKPASKVSCLSSVSSPCPARSSPRPDSMRVRRSGEAGMPSRMCSSMRKASTSSTSITSGPSQFRTAMPFSSSEAAKGTVRVRGASMRGCKAMEESGSRRVKRDNTPPSCSRRCPSSSSPQ